MGETECDGIRKGTLDASKACVIVVGSWMLVLQSFYTNSSQCWLKLESSWKAFTSKTTNAQALHHINLIRTSQGGVLASVLLIMCFLPFPSSSDSNEQQRSENHCFILYSHYKYIFGCVFL